MRNTKFARSKIYLGWAIQGRLVAQIVVFWLAYHVILGASLLAIEYLHQVPGYLRSAPEAPKVSFLDSFAHHYAWLVLFPVVVLPVLVFDCMRLLHRVVGPLKRVEDVLRRLTRGEHVAEVHFREHDLMGGVEEAFNSYLASIGPAPATADAEKNAALGESPLDEILRSAGGVVVHNDPLAADLPEHEREVAAHGAATVEVPVA